MTLHLSFEVGQSWPKEIEPEQLTEPENRGYWDAIVAHQEVLGFEAGAEVEEAELLASQTTRRSLHQRWLEVRGEA